MSCTSKFIESKFSHVERPPAASNGLGGRIRCDPVPHLWGQGTKVISNFLSLWPPSWCFIESRFHLLNDLQRPQMVSEDKHHVIRPSHLWCQGTKVISALLLPEATFMAFLNSVPGRRTCFFTWKQDSYEVRVVKIRKFYRADIKYTRFKQAL